MKRLAAVVGSVVLAATLAPAPAHAAGDGIHFGQPMPATACLVVARERDAALARADELDDQVVALSVQLRKTRAKVDRQAAKIAELRKRLRQQP